METTSSVSRGVFLFKTKKKSKSKKKNGSRNFDQSVCHEPWYQIYKSSWQNIERQIMDLNNRTYSVLLNDIAEYVKSFYGLNEASPFDGTIPSATLLTGVNQPDHACQFMALIHKIREEVTPHIAMVHSQDASTLKNLIENVVWQLICSYELGVYDVGDDDECLHFTKSRTLKKNQCTMKTLRHWYQEKYTTNSLSPKKKSGMAPKSLVIIIPDFESFNCNVLQDFVMIIRGKKVTVPYREGHLRYELARDANHLSSYVSSLPVVFIFGVATSVSALHKSFPYHVSSKLLIKVFHSHSSPVYMNQVLEEVFLTHTSPFHLSGKAFELLTDVFLFYDFSVSVLIQSIKFCMMDHFYLDDTKALLSCDRSNLEDNIAKLSAEDLEIVRRLPSFRPYLELQDSTTRISLFENDEFFKQDLLLQMNKLHDYMLSFYTCLRLLAVFIKDLPNNSMGKTVREMYTICTAENVTESQPFKESMQLIGFQSQVKLVETLKGAVEFVNSALKTYSPVKPFTTTPNKNNIMKDNDILLQEDLGTDFLKRLSVHLIMFLRSIEKAKTEAITIVSDEDMDEDSYVENTPQNRYKLKEKLLKATQVDRVQSEFEMVRARLVGYLWEVFAAGLRPARAQPFHELLVFSDVASVKKHIVGSPRGAVHTALSNAHHYLQCTCCRLPSSDSVVESLPDLCLVYKLHRECGKHVNLYDLLQAFAAVLRPADDGDENREVDTLIQVRFNRAMAGLQFLGFIKTSKRKTDHVMRLTW